MMANVAIPPIELCIGCRGSGLGESGVIVVLSGVIVVLLGVEELRGAKGSKVSKGSALTEHAMEPSAGGIGV